MRKTSSNKRHPVAPSDTKIPCEEHRIVHKEEGLSLGKQKSRAKRVGQNLSNATVENLKNVKPDEWNNVAIPVTEAIKVLLNEVAILNSRMNQSNKDTEDLGDNE